MAMQKRTMTALMFLPNTTSPIHSACARGDGYTTVTQLLHDGYTTSPIHSACGVSGGLSSPIRVGSGYAARFGVGARQVTRLGKN